LDNILEKEKMTRLEFIIILVAIILVLVGTIGHMMNYVHSDLLPPIGKWTNCGNLPEVCDVPELENNSLSDLAVYRFENGSMIVEYVGDAPIEK
jgi:hypothetical protein